MAYADAAALGILAGFVELASRYRDRPWALFRVPAAWVYLTINGAASCVALLVIRTFGWTFGAIPGPQVTVIQVLAAGLAALTVFRSSLLVVRVGSQDVGIGPSVLISTLLAIADRSIDRMRARDRSLLVTRVMRDVSFERSRKALPTFCLALLQNVTPAEQRDLGVAVDALGSSEMSEGQKSYSLGLLLLNLVGPDLLSDAVKALHAEISNTHNAEITNPRGPGLDLPELSRS